MSVPRSVAKRGFDVLAAMAMIALSSPLWAVAAVRIKREDGGPVFYRGTRVGRGGREFQMLKFRTMVVNADRMGGPSTPADDPRLTETGCWLRRTKLDEFPQFFNVMKGDMSIVGPRPQVAWDVSRYTDDERRLLSVRPGITDWASIRFRDEAGVLAGEADPDEAYDRLIRPEKMRLALCYVDRPTLRTDLRIVKGTIDVMLGRPVQLP